MNETTTPNGSNLSAKTNKTKGAKKHIFFDRPYLQLIVLPIILLFFVMLCRDILSQYLMFIPGINKALADALATVIIAAFLLAVHRLYFKGQVPVGITTVGFGQALLMGLPFIAMILHNAVGSEGTDLALTAIGTAFLTEVVAGIGEELIFRAFTLAHAMKGIKTEKEVLIIAIISSAMFGCTHLINLLAGQPIGPVIQVTIVGTVAALLFAAIYLRTGNILATMIYHTLIDMSARLGLGDSFIWTPGGHDVLEPIIVIGILASALFLLRKSRRIEILEVWKHKFQFVHERDID